MVSRGSSWGKLACDQRWLFLMRTTAQGPCGVAGLGEGLEGLDVSPCRNGGIAKLGAHAGILLEGLLGMGYNRLCWAYTVCSPKCLATGGLHVLDTVIKGLCPDCSPARTTSTVASTASMFTVSLCCRHLSIGLAAGPCLFPCYRWASLAAAAWLFSLVFFLIFLKVVPASCWAHTTS